MEDHELLREYAEHHSEGAFAELVARHINLVYSTALRVVGETHLAKDVAQTVFIGLARKPQSIHNPLALGGWLYRTTRFTAAAALRKEQRRRRLESAAMELNDLETDSRVAWEALAPHLDVAMSSLGPEDQDALALRFFQGKSLREVGQALGTSDDAAQKRITRALDKLRTCFARQGLAASSIVIASAMAAHAVTAAPAGLAASVAATSLAGAAGSGATALVLKLIGIMTATNLKITVTALMILAAVSTPVILHHHANRPKLVAAAEPTRPELAATQAGDAASALQARNAQVRAPAPTLLDQLFQAATNTLSPEQIEAYLQQNKRTAESLLAAFRVSQDKAYLREAAASFPKDPAVQFAVLAFDVFPEQKRQWLEAFKASSPDNALAWYLSASDYYKAKQTGLAIQELKEATGKPSFNSYATQTSQAVEEMYNLAGRSMLEAKHASTCGELAPHLIQMRSLASDMVQAQEQYRGNGDTASANSLAYMGLVLGTRLGNPANNLHLIDQLVGIAIEKKVLGQLDPAANYDFVGRPVNEVLADLDRQRDAIKQYSGLTQRVLPTLNETELANYLDRMKLYGEPEALAWLQTKYGQH